MLKRTFLIVALLLALPAFANAWTVNAKTSPTTGLGTISPPGNITYANGVNSAAFTVTPSGTNVVTRVTIDGVTQPRRPLPYVVPYTGKSYRYIVAYLAAAVSD